MGNCGVGSCVADEGELSEERLLEYVEFVDVADGVPQAQSREWPPSDPASLPFDAEFDDFVHDARMSLHPRDALMEVEDMDGVADEGNGPNRDFTQQLPVQSLTAIFPQLPSMLAKFLPMQDFLPLRAACTQQHGGLPSTALVERMVDLIEPAKEDVFLATAKLLMAQRRGASDEDFWKQSEYAPRVREAQASLWAFLTGLDMWVKKAPGAVVQVVHRMREFCFDGRKEVASSAQSVMVVAAKHCFTEAETDVVRHLFVQDLICILLRADDKVRLQACAAFASCGPSLLGTYNPAVTEALLHFCSSTRSDSCKSMGLKALQAFLDHDRALCTVVEPRLGELQRLRSLGPHEEMAVADITFLCAMESFRIAAEDRAREILAICCGALCCPGSLLACPDGNPWHSMLRQI